MKKPDPARFLTAKTLSEALPYMQRYDEKWLVVKYGGHAMGTARAMQNFAADITLIGQLGVNPVVVHGGGPQIGAMLDRLGVKTSFQDGLRVTDESAMEVVEMVLAGAISTSVVAAIGAAGGRAVGLSGVDANLMRAVRAHRLTRDPDSNLERVVDMGLVGSPERIDTSVLDVLAKAGFIPVIAPIGMGGDGKRYNVNADEAAGAIASALNAERLILMTDVDGVLDGDGQLIHELGPERAQQLIDNGIAVGGMIPKLRTALKATRSGVSGVVIVNGTAPHALLTELFSAYGAGTLITRNDPKNKGDGA